MNFYHVRVLNLPKEGSTWRFSSTYGVVATDVKNAIALVERAYPGVRVDAVNHHGKVDIVEENL